MGRLWPPAHGPAHSAAIKRGMARAKERYDSWHEPGDQMKCHRCGQPYDYDGFTGRPRQYCSNACRQAAYRERARVS